MKKKQAYLYCYKKDLNDATNYYTNLVESCIIESGYDVNRVYSLKDIKKPDLIFTITCIGFFKAKVRFPFVKTLNWVQGIIYEETKMKGLPKYYQWVLWLFEAITIWKSDALLFVSQKMFEYYRLKFKYKKDNYIIMPCYNCKLNDTVSLDKFNSPSFVYAGGLSKWQSINEILETYSLVERQIKNASLTLYCKQNDELIATIKKLGIQNFTIKYVSVDVLQQELLQYKYGFLLREANWVNAVSTPTKMNSYLAGYVIPIFSDAVDDFINNIHLGNSTLMAKTPLSPPKIAEMIIEYEKSFHEYSDFINNVKIIFNNHYNDDTYKTKIKKGINLYF